MAFALLTEGAEGESRKECINVFGFDQITILPTQTRYAAFRLTSRKGKSDFNLANSIWFSNKSPINSYFAYLAKKKYKALLKSVSFTDPRTKNRINSWISKKTHGMIPNCLKRISPRQSIMIVNAVYFKGSWDNEFNPRNTFKNEFTNSKNQVEKIDFMFKKRDILYHEDQHFRYAGFKYVDSSVIMVTALPKSSMNPLKGLDLNVVASLGKIGKVKEFQVKMPKFKMENQTDLVPILKAVGLEAPFENYQDFRKLVRGGSVVSSVIHQAKIEVDEKGTRAAAVTVIGMTTISLPLPSPEYFLQKPFSFFLVDTESSMILFSGVFRKSPQ